MKKKRPQNENEFQERVLVCLQSQLRTLSKKPKFRKIDFKKITTEKVTKLITGIKFSLDFKDLVTVVRESDVTVGFWRNMLDESQEDGVRNEFVPLLAFELKLTHFSSGEMLKKNEIYGKFKDVYPWIICIFLIHDADRIQISRDNILNHLRNFNMVLTDFGIKSRKLIHATLENRIDYVLNYWRF